MLHYSQMCKEQSDSTGITVHGVIGLQRLAAVGTLCRCTKNVMFLSETRLNKGS